MARCYLKGFLGSILNAHLAAAAWNFRKWIRKGSLFALLARLWGAIQAVFAAFRFPVPILHPATFMRAAA